VKIHHRLQELQSGRSRVFIGQRIRALQQPFHLLGMSLKLVIVHER